MPGSETCPVCGEKAIYMFQVQQGDVWRCKSEDCGHFFVLNVLHKDGLCEYSSNKQEERYIRRNHQLINYMLSQGVLAKGEKVLDIGSGEGHIATCFAERGFNVLCVEPSKEGRAILDSRGLKSVPYVSDIPKGEIFDFIYLIEVIEHVPLPTETIRNAIAHLSDSGWFFITTPSALGLMAKISKKRSNSFGIPSHIHFFTPRSLSKCLKLAGFQNIKCCYLSFIVGRRSLPAKIIAWLLNFAGLGGGIMVFARNPLRSGKVSS